MLLSLNKDMRQRLFRLEFDSSQTYKYYKNTTLLLGCGAAGALSGLFSAPIAGVVFVIEVLLMDMTMTNIIPLLISAVTGSLVSTLLMGKEVVNLFLGCFLVRAISNDASGIPTRCT